MFVISYYLTLFISDVLLVSYKMVLIAPGCSASHRQNHKKYFDVFERGEDLLDDANLRR